MTETPAHSKWSASGFEQRMLCPGSHVLQAGKPNSSSKFAAEGTAAHQVLTWALQEDRPAAAYIGRLIEADGFTFTVDEDMAGFVQVTIDYVHDLRGDDGIVFADIRVNYSSYLDVPEAEAWGTADVIVARGAEIIVIDLKYGMGVEVHAGYDDRGGVERGGVPIKTHCLRKPNPQMGLYALGALQAYNGIAGDFEHVRMAISQPRIKSAPSEYDLPVAELEEWGRSTARSAVNSCRLAEAHGDTGQAFQDTYVRPGEKQCKFCRAKATCSALRNEVAGTVFRSQPASPDEFENESVAKPNAPGFTEASWVAACLSQVDLIEDWCKAIRTEAERRLLAGDEVPGYKLVQGKKGARQWADKAQAEAVLKSLRLKEAQMYDFEVKSPTQIAKLGPQFDKDGNVKPLKEGRDKPVISARQWQRVAEVITQSTGKPHVAPADDPRPALVITPVIDDFENISDDLA